LPSFHYKEKESGLFGKIFRPLIDLEVFSEIENDWIKVREVLADTGADISILPRDTGELIVRDIFSGEAREIKGIVPYATSIIYIHKLKFRINSKEFELPVAIAESGEVLPIFGRVGGLDLFDANFRKGRVVSLE